MADYRLNQVLAIEGDAKNRAHRALTDTHRDLGRPALLEGIARSYEPAEEGGETYPAEGKQVQIIATEAIKDLVGELAKWWDTAATKERGNAKATANVTVGDTVIIEDVPVTYLLFLEKRLVDLRTFLAKLPTLDPAQDWKFDQNQNVYVTDFVKTAKTKKVPRNHVKAPATDKHPAQVDVYFEDVVVGHWAKRLFSGAISATQVNALTKRLAELQDAVKIAREAANSTTVTTVDDGQKVLDYLFGDL